MAYNAWIDHDGEEPANEEQAMALDLRGQQEEAAAIGGDQSRRVVNNHYYGRDFPHEQRPDHMDFEQRRNRRVAREYGDESLTDGLRQHFGMSLYELKAHMKHLEGMEKLAEVAILENISITREPPRQPVNTAGMRSYYVSPQEAATMKRGGR